MKAIVGQANIFKGRVKLDERDITGLATYKIAQLGVIYIPQTENVFSMLTVQENIRMAGYGSKTGIQDRITKALETYPMLETWLNRKANTLSGGERQILAMAMALERKPNMILFDEPTAHLAPMIAEQVIAKITELRDKFGISIIVVEQNVHKALEIADYAYILSSGRVVFKGEPKLLETDAQLGRLFFGETDPNQPSKKTEAR